MEQLAAHLKTGKTGEQVAAAYLASKGYEVLERNVRVGHDEIDMIAFDPRDQVLVFCEVKTRSSNHPDFSPVIAMTPRKKQALARGCDAYIAERQWEGGYRIDLLCVIGDAVTDHLYEICCD